MTYEAYFNLSGQHHFLTFYPCGEREKVTWEMEKFKGENDYEY